MEQFDFAIQVMTVGFLVVLFTLFALYVILLLFARIFYKKETKTTQKAPAVPAATLKDTDKSLDQRTTAAIVAAVYRYLQQESFFTTAGRINISVLPSSKAAGRSWQIAGRKSLLENKMELENIRRKKQRENI